jgi:periplasmic protein TonB
MQSEMSLSTRIGLSRNTVVVIAVIGLHAVGLYALQSGLLRRVAEVVLPEVVMAHVITPEPPKVEPPPPPPIAPAVQPKPQPVKTQALPPPPMPLAVAAAEPSPHAVLGVTSPQPPAPPIAAPVAEAPAPAPAPRIQLPDSNADYLNNKPPTYPAMSKRLGEQGKVVVRVFIDVDGRAKQAEIRTSSGFERLDQAALRVAQEWTYVPGKVNGEPKAMWFNVPINFVLDGK